MAALRTLPCLLLFAASCFKEEDTSQDDASSVDTGGGTTTAATSSTTQSSSSGSATSTATSAADETASSVDGSSGNTSADTGGNPFCGGAGPGLQFKPPESFNTPPAPWAVGAGTVLVNDDYEDLFVAGATSLTIAPYSNLFGGGFVPEDTIDLMGEEMIRGLATDDLDEDGRQDLVAVSRTTVHIFYGNGTNMLDPPIEIVMPDENLWTLALGDIVDNNAPEIIVGSGSTVWVLQGPAYTPNPMLSFEVGAAVGGISLGNLDGAGGIDMVVPDSDTEMAVGSYGIYVLLDLDELGSGTVSPIPYPSAPMPWRSRVGNVIGDNWNDVVVTHTDGGLNSETALYVYENMGQGVLANPQDLGPLPGLGGDVDIVDINCDGVPDIVVATVGEVRVFPGDGQGGLGAPESIAVGGAAAGMAVRDFNQDERPDVAVALFQQAALEIYVGE